MDCEIKVLKLFYEWSQATTEMFENENDIKAAQFLWEIEKLINKHVDKCYEKKRKKRIKKKLSEINALLLAEKNADELTKQAELLSINDKYGTKKGWTKLTKTQLSEINQNKLIADKIENIQKKSYIMMINNSKKCY